MQITLIAGELPAGVAIQDGALVQTGPTDGQKKSFALKVEEDGHTFTVKATTNAEGALAFTTPITRGKFEGRTPLALQHASDRARVATAPARRAAKEAAKAAAKQ